MKQWVQMVRRWRYELIALLTGACVMILEIVGARLIAPYFGTSTYVWTAMIGVILGALSIGFWYGGRLADRYDSKQDLGLIIAGAAALVFIASLLQEEVLRTIASQRMDLRLSSFLAAVVLFGPPSLLIGMVSPHLAKIQVKSLKTTGTTIGRLEAAGAIGSITGTFLSGYVLLAYFGARRLTFMLVVVLLLTSFLASRRTFLWGRLVLIVLAVLSALYPGLPAGVAYDKDSAYSRYWVKQAAYNGREANLLLMDSYSIQSASYLDQPTEPAFSYAQRMLEGILDFDNPKQILVIGGGAYTLPTVIRQQLPDTKVDVAEIDPAMGDIAERYFGYEPQEGIRVFYEDGRSFLNRHTENYDIIIMDAFSSLTPPFHLTSREAVELLAANLGDNGVVMVNAPGRYNGEFIGSMIKTYRQVFGSVELYQANTTNTLSGRQNFIILAGNNPGVLSKVSQKYPDKLMEPSSGFVLTDDYAPVERLSY